MPSLAQPPARTDASWDTNGYASGDDYPTKLNYQNIAIMAMINRLEEDFDPAYNYLSDDSNMLKNGEAQKYLRGDDQNGGNPFIDFFIDLFNKLIGFFRMLLRL